VVPNIAFTRMGRFISSAERMIMSTSNVKWKDDNEDEYSVPVSRVKRQSVNGAGMVAVQPHPM
jgi:hypothetical protein